MRKLPFCILLLIISVNAKYKTNNIIIQSVGYAVWVGDFGVGVGGGYFPYGARGPPPYPSVSYSMFVPDDINPNIPMNFRFVWMTNGCSGNVQFELQTLISKEGMPVFAYIHTTHPDWETFDRLIVHASGNTEMHSNFQFKLNSSFIDHDNVLLLGLQRNIRSINDTANCDVYAYASSLSYDTLE